MYVEKLLSIDEQYIDIIKEKFKVELACSDLIICKDSQQAKKILDFCDMLGIECWEFVE